MACPRSATPLGGIDTWRKNMTHPQNGAFGKCVEEKQGRFIGDVHDKSAPTDVQVILLICIIGPYECAAW